MSFIAVAIGASAVAGIAGGVMQANAQKKATAANRKNVQETNELNYQMFRESRGEGGNAILPLYLPGGTEERMAGKAVQVFDSITGQPINVTLDEYNQIMESMLPGVTGGNAVINSVYNGEMQDRRLGDLQPVLAARSNLAEANAAAVDVALQEERNRLAAAEAAKGYTGGGTFDAQRALAATIAARQAAAQARAGTALANATDVRGVKEGMTNLQLQSLDVPLARTGQLIALSQAPQAGLVQRQQLAQRALDWFKLNPGNPPAMQTFQAPATPSTGALIAAGVGQAAGGAMSYLQNKQLIDAMQANNAYAPTAYAYTPTVNAYGAQAGSAGLGGTAVMAA